MPTLDSVGVRWKTRREWIVSGIAAAATVVAAQVILALDLSVFVSLGAFFLALLAVLIFYYRATS